MPSTNMSDLLTAKSLAHNAIRNPDARHEYFDFLKSMREKHGPEYSTMIHQYSSKLMSKGTEPVTEAKGLGKHVSIMKGHYAGQTGYVRQIKTDRIRNKVYLDIDLEDGGQTVEPKENCRVIKNVAETIYSDNKPTLSGLSFNDLERLSESSGANFHKFNQTLLKNLNLPSWTNTIETYGVYLRKLTEHKNNKLVEGQQSEVEQELFNELSARADGSVKSASVGDFVALLHLATLNIPGHKIVAKLNGFLIPKEITKITNNGASQQLEFSDGSRYPEKDGGDIFQQTQGWNMTKLFADEDTASKAYTFYALVGKKMSDSLDFDISVKRGNVDETIVKTGGEYELKSSKGKNLGKFPSKVKAEKHEQEVNYFKHMDEDGEKRFAVGDTVLVKNYQGVGKIHSILHRGAVRVILPNNVRAEVDMGDLRPANNKFEPTVQFESEETNPTDAITVDIPLMIRLMEYAKEDAADDMALHQVAEKLTALSQEGRTLTMNDYDAICSTDNTQGI